MQAVAVRGRLTAFYGRGNGTTTNGEVHMRGLVLASIASKATACATPDQPNPRLAPGEYRSFLRSADAAAKP